MKSRLFCFGDSFVDYDIPKYHWTYYLSQHYEFYKFGVRGSDNNSILFQLGDLPEFEDGDRVLIVFTEPGRIPTRFYANGNLINKLACLKVDEHYRWLNGERDNEIKFFKKLQNLLKHYNPIFVTWNETFFKGTEDFVSLIQVSSNWQEGAGEKRDDHPGPKGCYDMYKKIHTLLGVDEPFVDFKIEDKVLI
jgi:hypothetical protein